VNNSDRLDNFRSPSAPETSDDSLLTSRVRIIAWCLLSVAGLIDAVFSRHAMQADGVSYLDMGDALVRGDWKMAVNGYWSPLYPWLQGVVLRLLKPSPYSEFTVVHFVNFLIYLFALSCFDFLLQAAVTDRLGTGDAPRGRMGLPKWAVFAVGYAVFLWSSLSLITLERVGPDLLMAGFLYLATGLLLRLWARPRSYWLFIALGAVFGLGYLAKAPVLPLSFLFLAVAWILAGDWRRATPRVLAATVVFLAVSSPWVVALSRAKGHFTFGDSGKDNYVFLINHVPPRWYSEELGTAGGHYLHPVRKTFDAPPVYEFAAPIRGTIPVWYDPSYWADGATPRVSLKQELSIVRRWAMFYFDSLFTEQAGLLVGFVVLCLMVGRGFVLEQLAARWPIWAIGLAGLGMYAMVYVERRYVGEFFALLWVGLFSGLKMPPGREGQRLVPIVTFAVVLVMALPVARSVAGHLIDISKGQANVQWQVAQELDALGVMPGDRVGRIGGWFGPGWARLLGVTVVAEIPDANTKNFWCDKPEVQAQVIDAFRRIGVTAIVAMQSPPDVVFVPGPDWRKLGDGTYYALRLAPRSAN
jgi:4-amino-4-deoxy-L-arabinose transferase-like glycosyltransferase